MSELRTRMDNAMILRGLADRTRASYLACVTGLAKFHRRSPDTLSAEEIQAYLLYLITEKKLAYASVNQAACAFRFKRIRHYGLLSAARKKVGLAAARAVLGVPPPEPAVIESVADFLHRVARFEQQRCPSCGVGKFQVVATLLPERRRPAPRAPP